MKGLFHDINLLLKTLKEYKRNNKNSFWTFKKILLVILQTLKKTWVLILLGLIVFLSIAILALTNAMGEILYFSLVIIFVFISYVIINIIILTFQHINNFYYEELTINKTIIKRVGKLFSFIISIILVIGIGLTQMWFVKAYINAPLEGYSYYDEYGNLLSYQHQDGNISRNVKGHYTLENQNVIRTDDGKLEKIELEFIFKNLYSKRIIVEYEDDRITRMIEEKNCSSDKVDDWFDEGLHSAYYDENDKFIRYSYGFRYSYKETIIDYIYNKDSFVQKESVTYSIERNKNNIELFTSYKEQIYKKVKDESTTKIILEKDSKTTSLSGSKEFIVNLFKENIITKLEISTHPFDRDKLSDNDIYQRAKKLMNFKEDSPINPYWSIYYNEVNAIEFDLDSWNISYIQSSNNLLVEDKLLDFEFFGTIYDEWFLSKSTYENNYIRSEYQHLITDIINDEEIPDEYNYEYKHIYNKNQIHHMDMYEEDQFVYRYLFDYNDFGFIVKHYSYQRDNKYKFKDFKGNNHLPNGVGWNKWTPMSLVRNTDNYTNGLVLQKYPYLYLLETE